MKPSILKQDEYSIYYEPYIKQVPEMDLLDALSYSEDQLIKLLNSTHEEKLLHRYSAEKWSIKEIVQHLVDAERVFTYRALRFARKDRTPLLSFDHDSYVPASDADSKTRKMLIAEYHSQRTSTKVFFKNLSQEALKRKGIASDVEQSVRALGFIIAGHDLHHIAVIKERYL